MTSLATGPECAPSPLSSTVGTPFGARSATARPGRAGRRWSWLDGTDAFGPALVVSLALALLVTAGVVTFKGNPTGFVRFGRNFVSQIQPPRGAVIARGAGYDGQYFWALAQDPLVLRERTLGAFADQSFRMQRVAYPALAYLLGAGRPDAILWSLVAINVIVVLGITVAVSFYARRRGRSGWWGLAVGLLPGFMYALLGDLSDALAVASMLGGLMAWQRGRRWPAAGLLSVAVLAREPMMLAVIAIVIDACVTGWRSRPAAPERSHTVAWARLRTVARAIWPAAVVPALAFMAWQTYIQSRYGDSTSAPWTAFAPPFAAIATEVRHALQSTSAVNAVWDLGYLGLMLAGLGVAVAAARRGVSAPTVAAVLFSLSLLVLTFGYAPSYTRLSAPLFACLLLVGLERRSRGALGVCAVAAALGALVPLSIG